MKDAAVFYRVSGDDQHSENQISEVKRFCAHHDLHIVRRFTVSDTAWKNGGGPEYKAELAKALDAAWRGEFSVLVVWSLDRICRAGIEELLRIVRQFRERGCVLLSAQESWMNGSPDTQDLFLAIAGWMAERESARRSERIRAGLARRKAEGLPVGRKPGSKDLTPRRCRARATS